MKVYIVTDFAKYDDDEKTIMGVFASLKQAEMKCQELDIRADDNIEEHEVIE